MVSGLIILGPTGVGKTELSLRLAEHYQCPIINADSRQIYRDLPIGTAAPTADDLARVRHYLVGTHALEQTYNAGQFARDAEAILNQVPFAIISGGSMLYIDALCNGLDDLPPVPAETRDQVRREFEAQGLTWLQEQVKKLDPNYWKTVDQQNPQRLLHCLEVTLSARKPYSELLTHAAGQESKKANTFVKIGLTRPREELYDRINRRVEQMIDNGLEEEARNAYGRLAAPTVGYREMFDYFEGKITREEAIRLIQQNSRHYAKRQMTWWRRDPSIHWIDATTEYETILHIIDRLVRHSGMQEEHG